MSKGAVWFLLVVDRVTTEAPGWDAAQFQVKAVIGNAGMLCTTVNKVVHHFDDCEGCKDG